MTKTNTSPAQNLPGIHTTEDLAEAMLKWLIAKNKEARARRIQSRAASARLARIIRAQRQQNPVF
jgi:hypothetical protein